MTRELGGMAVELEAFYYNQDEQYECVIIIDYENHLAHQIMNVKREDCIANQFIFISKKTANTLITGLNNEYFSIDVHAKEGDIPSSSKKTLEFMKKIQNKYSKPEHMGCIKKEHELSNKMNECTVKYWDLVDCSKAYLKKCNLEEFEKFIIEKNGNNEMTESEKISKLASIMLQKKENGFEKIEENLMKDENYKSYIKLQPLIKDAFFELMEAYLNLEKHFEKELSMFPPNYQSRIDEFADKGWFLYFMNTPDWPLEEAEYDLDDIINYELFSNGMNLRDIISPYIKNDAMGDIYKREAADLKSSFILLYLGLYWSALRNMYSLLDHHHKLCANTFNGYNEKKKTFKNGKERSEQIQRIMRLSKRYEKIWKKLNKAIKEIYSKKGSERFVSRNAIVHGDYENMEVKPTAMDVIKIIFLYVSLRKIVDHIKVIELIFSEVNIYLTGHLINK